MLGVMVDVMDVVDVLVGCCGGCDVVVNVMVGCCGGCDGGMLWWV